jgi:hypothetical protein
VLRVVLIAIVILHQQVKYLMRIYEISNTIKPKSPLTPAQQHVQALKGNVDRARTALQVERDRQRQQRDAERKRKLAFPASNASTVNA